MSINNLDLLKYFFVCNIYIQHVKLMFKSSLKAGSNQFNPYSPIKKEDIKVEKVSKKVNKMKLNAPTKPHTFGISTDPSDPDQFLVPDPATQAWIQERQLERLKNTTDTGILYLDQQTNPPFARADDGALWVETGTPNSLHFQNNQGSDGVVDITPTNPFHGYWASLVKGDMTGFDNAFAITSSDVDAYIFIDTTQNPIQIHTIAGNGRVVRGNQSNEVAIDPSYVQIDAVTLVSTVIANQSDPITPLGYAALTLQNDGTLAAIIPSVGIANLYAKITINDLPNPIIPFDAKAGDYPDYTRPTLLAQYLFDHMIYHITPTNATLTKDFIGFYAAEARFQQYLTTGVTFTSNVLKFRKTFNSSGMTDVYTTTFAYATAGATITISGAANTWAAINGTYVNGVSVHQFAGIPNPSPTHIDSGVNGTYQSHFLLNFDSSALAAFTANAGAPTYGNGTATSVHFGAGPVTVSATYKITDDMDYCAFYAAMTAMFLDIFKVDQHHGYSCWLADAGDNFLPQTFADLQNALTAGTAVKKDVRIRGNYPQAIEGYNNPVFQGVYSPTSSPLPQYPWLFNDAYGYLPVATGLFDYNISINYLTGVRNLYYTLTGTPTMLIHSLVGLFGYKNISGTSAGGAYFIGTTAPYNVVNPAAGNPNPNIWTLLGGAFNGSDAPFAANTLYFGFVNPVLTGGKRIGYIHIGDEARNDPFGFVYDYQGRFVNGVTTRPFFEAECQLFSEIFKYLNSSGPLYSLILDTRVNSGGFYPQDLALASFVGGQRHLQDPSLVIWRDNGNRPSVSYASLGTQFYLDALNVSDTQNGTCDVNLSISRYGANSVFQAGKFIELVSANSSQSAGDIITLMWLGQNNDKNLGAGVQAQFIGSVDGRIKGGSIFGYSDCTPKQLFSNRLYDQNGNPVATIPGVREDDNFGVFSDVFNGHIGSIQDATTAINQAPTLLGGAGNFPLPEEFESTIYVDHGYIIPHPDPPLPGWVVLVGTAQPVPGTPGTWRDRWLEQSILAAVV